MTTEDLVIAQQSKLLNAYQSEQKIMQNDMQKLQSHIEKLVGALIGVCLEYGTGRQLRIPKSTMKRVHAGLKMNIIRDPKTDELVVTVYDSDTIVTKNSTTVKEVKASHLVALDGMKDKLGIDKETKSEQVVIVENKE